jgi:CRISPR-associated protein Cas1
LNLLPKKIEEYVKKQKIIDYSIEAQVAATYFKILYGESFERRSEKDEINTIINSFLNYGYTILMSAMARSIIKSGYDCRISLFHKSFSNHTALASDLMEPFRPCVD